MAMLADGSTANHPASDGHATVVTVWLWAAGRPGPPCSITTASMSPAPGSPTAATSSSATTGGGTSTVTH